MYSTMAKSILILCFISVANCALSPSGDECQEIFARGDACLRHAVLVGRANITVLPKNVGDVDNMVCSTVDADITCISEMRKCLRAFPRTIFNIAIKSVRKTIKKMLCENSATKQGLVNALECLKSEVEQAIAFGLLDKLAAIMDEINDNATTTEIFPSLCCSVKLTRQHVSTTVQELCPQLAVLLDEVIQGLFGEVLDMGCGRWHKPNVCDEKIPERMEQFRYRLYNTNDSSPYSPLIPVLGILKRLDSELTSQ